MEEGAATSLERVYLDLPLERCAGRGLEASVDGRKGARLGDGRDEEDDAVLESSRSLCRSEKVVRNLCEEETPLSML